MTGREGRRHKQLLDTLKVKERILEALDRAVWRIRGGRGYGPVVRQEYSMSDTWRVV